MILNQIATSITNEITPAQEFEIKEMVDFAESDIESVLIEVKLSKETTLFQLADIVNKIQKLFPDEVYFVIKNSVDETLPKNLSGLRVTISDDKSEFGIADD